MTYSPLLILHIAGGISGVITGFSAFAVRKGARAHRMYGDAFVISMLTMAASGGVLAWMKSQTVNEIAAVFTIYLVATAWLTMKRPANESGAGEIGLMLVGLLTGATCLRVAAATAKAGTAPKGVAAGCVVFGALLLLSAAGDVRVLVRGGVSGAQRLVRHIWRMGFATFIATASFFLGRAGDPVLRRSGLRATLFNDAVRRTHLPDLPVILVVVLTIFWLGRVRFSKAYRRQEEPRPHGTFVHAIAEGDRTHGAAR